MIGRSVLVYTLEGTLSLQDRNLLKRLRFGDRDALRQIYEKYRDDLFTVAVSLLRDVHAAEDCLQDVFVKLAGSVERFNVQRNLKSYLISCVANRARDQIRKKTVRFACPLDQLSELAISADPARGIVSNEECGQVLEALSELPYEQREVFVLHVQGEVKFRAIAKMQDVSTRTVQSRYRYAIDKLRVLLEKGGRS